MDSVQKLLDIFSYIPSLLAILLKPSR